jgi:hypothetical protein
VEKKGSILLGLEERAITTVAANKEGEKILKITNIKLINLKPFD